jgi:hypothetical protein
MRGDCTFDCRLLALRPDLEYSDRYGSDNCDDCSAGASPCGEIGH